MGLIAGFLPVSARDRDPRASRAYMWRVGYVFRGIQMSLDLMEGGGPALSKPQLSNRHTLPRTPLGGLCRFEIHREEQVMVTSTQFCGGDWRSRLCSHRGNVLAEGRGFASEKDCREAITILKDKAGMATVTLTTN
jgi:uncharacterized protein YegP (UPF0339 family)